MGTQEASAEPSAAGAQDSVVATPTTATISNMLPVDGCSYPVTIGDADYAPDGASIAPLRDRIPAGGSITVRINYQLTGRVGRVECGFGASFELPEISFRVEGATADEESTPAS